MAVPYLKRSCCCSLETGTLVLAYLSLIGSVGTIIDIVAGEMAILFHMAMAERLQATFLGFLCIHLVVSMLLIIAVTKRWSALVIPWLVNMALGVVAGIIIFIYLLVISKPLMEEPGQGSGIYPLSSGFSIVIDHLMILLAFGILLGCGLGMYFWWVVFSLHHELKLAEKNKLYHELEECKSKSQFNIKYRATEVPVNLYNN